MRRTYSNAPLAEAVCEFRFAPGAVWDLTKPGLFYQQVRAEYPIVQQQSQLQLGIELSPQAIPTSVSTAGGPARGQFFSSERTAVVQIEQDALIINRVRPYPGWEQFRDQVQGALSHYWAVAEPAAIARVALRYINQFPMDSEADIEQRFNLYPHVPGAETSELRNMLMIVELYTPQPDGLFRITFARALLENSVDALVMDLQLTSSESSRFSQEDVFQWLDVAHSTIEDMFERSITDETRLGLGEIVHAD